MPDDRPQADRIRVAQLTGEARHRARWRSLTGDEESAAVAELEALAGGRAYLLAEVAGIFEGTSEGELDEPLARQAAQLCRLVVPTISSTSRDQAIFVDRATGASLSWYAVLPENDWLW